MVDGMTSRLSSPSPPRTRTATRAIAREDIHSLPAALSGGLSFTMFPATKLASRCRPLWLMDLPCTCAPATTTEIADGRRS